MQQVNWDPSKVKGKLKRDIESHVAYVPAAKLSELCYKYEVAHFFEFVCSCVTQNIEFTSNLSMLFEA